MVRNEERLEVRRPGRSECCGLVENDSNDQTIVIIYID